MSGDKYFITDQHSPYFLTLTVVQLVDLLCRRDYRDILVESLNYCTKEKYITIFSWVIMSNHLHLVFHSPSEESSKGL
jgi:REP element-mobilizing transposase RayT